MPIDELITVAIPLYNHQNFIEECLDSVVQQGVQNVELILLDDGSKDDGYGVACRWLERNQQHFKRTLFQTQPNAGITRTMDRLICWAEGQFILLVASDDVLLPGSIASRLAFFEDDRVNAVFGDAIPIDETGRVLGRSAIGGLGCKGAREALKDPRTVFWELLFRWNVYGSILMCRRSSLVSSSGASILNLGLYAEDMQLYYGFAARGSLRYLDAPVAKYRMHVGSTCRSPEHDAKIRENIFQSREHALQTVSGLKYLLLRLQMMTYYRKRGGLSGLLLKPLVLGSYGLLELSRMIYDWSRIVFLKQVRIKEN